MEEPTRLSHWFYFFARGRCKIVASNKSSNLQLNKIFQDFAKSRTSYYNNLILDGYDKDAFKSRKGFTIIDNMLSDDFVYALIEIRKTFMLSTSFDFKYEYSTDNKLQDEILDFVRCNFINNYYKNLNKDLYQILSADEYGFSISEMIFVKEDYKNFTDKVWIKRLKTIPPHSIDFYNNDLGDITRIVQRGVVGGTIDLPVWKFIIYSKNSRFDNPYGTSDFKRVYLSWFLKDKIIKLWGIYLQRFATDFPYAKVPANFTEEKTAQLLSILESMQQGGAAVFPDDVDINFLGSSKSSSLEYDRAINSFNTAIARGLLIPDLLGFSNSGATGSYALGTKHFEMFVDLINFQRGQIEDLINDQVIKYLVDINYGKQNVYPSFRFLPFKKEVNDKMLQLFLNFVEKGAPVTIDDYNYFRTLIDFPDYDKDADQLELKIKTDQSSGSIDSYQVQSAEPITMKKKFTSDNDILRSTPNRAPNKYEKRIDFIKEDTEIKIREEKCIDDLSRIFNKIKINLKETIIKKEIMVNNKVDEIDKLQLKYKGDVKDTMRAAFIDIYDLGFSNAKKEIQNLKKEQKNFDKNPNDLLVPSEEAKKIAENLINQRTFQAVGELNDTLLNKVKKALIAGIEKGQSTQDIMKEIDDIFNAVTLGASAAELTYSAHLIETIVRTNYTSFYNLARKQIASSKDMGGFIAMYQFSAIMDDRTTLRCQSADQFIAKKDDPVWSSLTPPLHYNCRSTIRYITVVDVDTDNITPSPELDLNELKVMPGGDSFL